MYLFIILFYLEQLNLVDLEHLEVFEPIFSRSEELLLLFMHWATWSSEPAPQIQILLPYPDSGGAQSVVGELVPSPWCFSGPLNRLLGERVSGTHAPYPVWKAPAALRAPRDWLLAKSDVAGKINNCIVLSFLMMKT